jgi:AP-4 complex subunit epsilon-1
MAASLNYFVDVCKQSPETYKELTSSFVVILKQIIEHKLPREYDYHRMPAPWIQTKLMEILGYLGKDDKETSNHIYEVIQMTLKRAEDLAINIGHALVYQCIKCILTIYPSEPLLEKISKSIASFFANENNNLKYVGVTTLNAMLKIDLKYAEDHQENVIECLECSDDTLKLKTLDLLYTMTNKDNVEAIIQKMLEHLQHAPADSRIRRDLVKKIYQSVEKFSPNKKWFVKTMNKLFEMGADLITLDISNKFINVI